MMRRRAELAGAEVIGALILFGIFVATIAILNVTAVPNAGLATEEEHYENVLSALNGLQAEAEAADEAGATVARSIELAPDRSVAQDFFSFFMASPARSSGEILFEPDYGDIAVSHTRDGSAITYNDLGGAGQELTVGRLLFDPHSNFRGDGKLQLENGAIVSTSGSTSTLRFDPQIRVALDGNTILTTIQARILNGTAANIGGTAPVRLALVAEASTLTQTPEPNANQVVFRLETDHGTAWRDHLQRISIAAGLLPADYTLVYTDGGTNAPDVVTWTLLGRGAGTTDDIRLSTGVAVHKVTMG